VIRFESRNPAVNWAEKWDGRVETWRSDAGNFQLETTVVDIKSDVMKFE